MTRWLKKVERAVTQLKTDIKAVNGLICSAASGGEGKYGRAKAKYSEVKSFYVQGEDRFYSTTEADALLPAGVAAAADWAIIEEAFAEVECLYIDMLAIYECVHEFQHLHEKTLRLVDNHGISTYKDELMNSSETCLLLYSVEVKERRMEASALERCYAAQLAATAAINGYLQATTAATEVTSTPNSSLVQSDYEQRLLRFDIRQLPKFSGKIEDYMSWRDSFKSKVISFGLTDKEVGGWISSEQIQADPSIRLLLANKDVSEVWTVLERRYGSETMQILGQVDRLLAQRKLKYGSSMTKFSLEVEALLDSIRKCSSASDLFMIYIVRSINFNLPEEVRVETSKVLSSMKAPDADKMVEVLNALANFAVDATRTPARYAVNYASVDSEPPDGGGGGGGGNGGGGRPKQRQCSIDGCSEFHPIFKCDVFHNLGDDERYDQLVKKRLCRICLDASHETSKCRRASQLSCLVEGCGQNHNTKLHYAFPNGPRRMANLVVRAQEDDVPYLGVQLVDVKGYGKPAVTLFDSGSNTTIMTKDFMVKAGLRSRRSGQTVHIPGSTLNSNSVCPVPLVDCNGQVHVARALVVDSICRNISSFPPHRAMEEFKIQPNELDHIVNKEVDLLVGLSSPKIFPVEIDRTENAYMYRSRFGKGIIVAGTKVISTVPVEESVPVDTVDVQPPNSADDKPGNVRGFGHGAVVVQPPNSVVGGGGGVVPDPEHLADGVAGVEHCTTDGVDGGDEVLPDVVGGGSGEMNSLLPGEDNKAVLYSDVVAHALPLDDVADHAIAGAVDGVVSGGGDLGHSGNDATLKPAFEPVHGGEVWDPVPQAGGLDPGGGDDVVE